MCWDDYLTLLLFPSTTTIANWLLLMFNVVNATIINDYHVHSKTQWRELQGSIYTLQWSLSADTIGKQFNEAYSVHKSGNERSTGESCSQEVDLVWEGRWKNPDEANTEGAPYDVIETESELLKREKMWQNHTSMNAWPIQTQHRQLWEEDSFCWGVSGYEGNLFENVM